jgi:HSP90 family molecular chaperone
VPVRARRWHQCRNAIDQLQWREGQLIHLGATLDGSVHFHDLAHILFGQAVLAEGGLPADPAAYVKRVNALLS